MAIVVEKNSKPFEIPEDGLYQAVLADIVDLGEVETQFGLKHKVQFVYILSETDSEGRPFRLFQRFTASLSEKANLFKLIRRLTGKNPGDTFDLEVLLGSQCQLAVQQNEGTEGRIFANIMSVLACAKGQNVQVPADFQRKCDQKSDAEPAAAPKPAATAKPTATKQVAKPAVKNTPPATTKVAPRASAKLTTDGVQVKKQTPINQPAGDPEPDEIVDDSGDETTINL